MYWLRNMKDTTICWGQKKFFDNIKATQIYPNDLTYSTLIRIFTKGRMMLRLWMFVNQKEVRQVLWVTYNSIIDVDFVGLILFYLLQFCDFIFTSY